MKKSKVVQVIHHLGTGLYYARYSTGCRKTFTQKTLPEKLKQLIINRLFKECNVNENNHEITYKF